MNRLTALCVVALAAGGCPAPSVAQEVRQILPLEAGWRFHDGELAGTEGEDQADAAWQAVRLPHTWNRVGYYLHSGEGSGTNRPATVNKRQGVGWYKLDFTPAANLAARQNWLEFDGASRVTKVWRSPRNTKATSTRSRCRRSKRGLTFTPAGCETRSILPQPSAPRVTRRTSIPRALSHSARS